jgi:acetyl-CoA decarbonylase/synthase complex subunit delta
MMVNPGEEGWKVKESRVGEGVPAAWGDWEKRALNWEAVTATALVLSGANLLVLRHPATVRRIHALIGDLRQEAAQT